MNPRWATLSAVTRRADILIAAVGRPGLVDASMVKPGAVVTDVGINRAFTDRCHQSPPISGG
ncbi:hypothetical protein [Trichothermofontia sp.]